MWDLLRGGAPQQRAWTFGESLLSSGRPNLEVKSNGLAEEDGEGRLPRPNGDGCEGSFSRHTSQRPTPLIEGVTITCVAAGEK